MTLQGILRRMHEQVREEREMEKERVHENYSDFIDLTTGIIMHVECLEKAETG